MVDPLDELTAEALAHVRRERLEKHLEGLLEGARISRTNTPLDHRYELEHGQRVIDLLMRAKGPENEDALGWRRRMLRVLGPQPKPSRRDLDKLDPGNALPNDPG